MSPHNAVLELPRAGEFAKQYLKGPDQVLVAFDFDGTLAPIASRPDQVRLDTEVAQALQVIASRRRILICTGRAVSDILKFLPDGARLDVIGNHGLEWRIWGEKSSHQGPVIQDRTPENWSPWKEAFLEELKVRIQTQGGEIEDKGASITLHFRNSGTEYWQDPNAREWLEARVTGPAQLLEGNMAWNILPRGASKGEAISQYVREMGFKKLVYFGDEPTDETVFGHPSLDVVGVKVGEGQTEAKFRLPSVKAVHHWLGQWRDLNDPSSTAG